MCFVGGNFATNFHSHCLVRMRGIIVEVARVLCLFLGGWLLHNVSLIKIILL